MLIFPSWKNQHSTCEPLPPSWLCAQDAQPVAGAWMRIKATRVSQTPRRTTSLAATAQLTSRLFELRLDKFLKVSRLAKRRSEAHEALVAGRITREDGRALKPGYVVRVGDVLTLHYARKVLTVRVLVVPERVVPGLRDVAMYDVLEERRDDPVDWL